MTITEALKQDIKFVRRPEWNETAKIELPAPFNLGHGVWCKLHDVGTVTEITIWQVDDQRDDWIPA